MKRSDLQFSYPENLVATSPKYPPRVMWVEEKRPSEISFAELLEKFQAGDILVVNETKVIPRRIFGKLDGQELDVLFLKKYSPNEWEVLTISKKIGSKTLELPDGVTLSLLQSERPIRAKVSRDLDDSYFETFGEMPLPPYIYKSRGVKHSLEEDSEWYQTSFAKNSGSVAAPTASLHFKKPDLDFLQNRRVEIIPITLHVGAGTFLPITVEKLDEHVMHKENVEISFVSWDKIRRAKDEKRKIWVLGTTATRAVESCERNLLPKDSKRETFVGTTDLFIKPGFDFKIVDQLLTNFHQPESSLIAMVAAKGDLETVHSCYQWAIAKDFRLFSYGDLSVWN